MGTHKSSAAAGKNREARLSPEDDRRMLNGMLWIVRIGAQWREYWRHMPLAVRVCPICQVAD